jgi:hypothetical protein
MVRSSRTLAAFSRVMRRRAGSGADEDVDAGDDPVAAGTKASRQKPRLIVRTREQTPVLLSPLRNDLVMRRYYDVECAAAKQPATNGPESLTGP